MSKPVIPSPTKEMHVPVGLSIKAKSIDKEERTIDVVMTTIGRDRDGDIIDPGGLDFSAFMKNPVVLWAHDMNKPPVGKVLEVKPQKTRVEAKVQFAETEFAREVFGLYAGEYMAAWSIGFLPKKWERIEASKDQPPGFHVLEAEVVELSAVPVPANPQALAKAMNDGTLSAKGLANMCGPFVIEPGGDVAMKSGAPAGLTLGASAFVKTIAEAVEAGRVLTRAESVRDPAAAGMEIEFEPVRVSDGEIKEARILGAVVKVYQPESTPAKETPAVAATSPDASRDESDDDQIGTAMTPHSLHLMGEEVAAFGAALSSLDLELSEVID